MGIRSSVSVVMCFATLALGGADGSTQPEEGWVRLTLAPTGARERLGRFAPQKIEMTADKPEQVKKEPADLVSPRYGVLPAGYGDDAASHGWIVCIDGQGETARLHIDTNRNGDLTDDPAATWALTTVDIGEGKTSRQYRGNAWIGIGSPDAQVRAELGMYQFAPAADAKTQAKSLLFYYRDYVYEGEVALGSRRLHAVLSDEAARGDFQGRPDGAASGVVLLLDLDGNGEIDATDQVIDVRSVFRFGDLNYEITDMKQDGSQFRIVRSSKATRPPTGLEVGQSIPAFIRKTMDGKTVHFPTDYAGKIVFLKFWATNCPTCMEHLPEAIDALSAYKSQGFDILGVSLDSPNTADTVKRVCAENGVEWPQIYESQVWNSALVKQLGVTSMPFGFLIDGDNGEILAKGETLRDSMLAVTVKAALDRRQKNAVR